MYTAKRLELPVADEMSVQCVLPYIEERSNDATIQNTARTASDRHKMLHRYGFSQKMTLAECAKRITIDEVSTWVTSL
jgi:hypothetical protein